MASKMKTVEDAASAFKKLAKWASGTAMPDGEEADPMKVMDVYAVGSMVGSPKERMIVSYAVLMPSEDGSPMIGVKLAGTERPRIYPISDITSGSDGIVMVEFTDGESMMFRELKQSDAEWVTGDEDMSLDDLVKFIEKNEVD